MDLVRYFKEITMFEPYSFQIELASKILEKKRVIMQAPTGSGKTWASIIPFLISRAENIDFPKKLIYVLPLRALANSLYIDISKNKFVEKNGIKVTIQTGEQNNDPYFMEGDIIFTTIDQVLSSLLCIPFSISQRQGNINAGAIFSSYLVFDEFHLLDSSTSLSTVFFILKKFGKYMPFCLMTATLSIKLLDMMCNELKIDRVIVDEEKLLEMKNQKDKKRIIEVKRSDLTIDSILINHKKLSIVICNRVERTQELYLGLEKSIQDKEEFQNTKLICINSRFTSTNRKHLEDLIKETFKKDSKDNAILVSTQIIEVGIDISCDTMHLEVSPINSVLQRIGRCARYTGEEGKVFVYDVIKEDTKQPYLPYDEKLCISTLDELGKISGNNLDYFMSQKLIDKILTEKEINELVSIRESNRLNDIRKCWINPEKRYAKELIREINNVSIIVCDNFSRMKNPYESDTISISRYTLINRIKKIEKENEDDWIVGIVEEDNLIFDLSDEKSYKITKIGVNDERLNYETLFILNSRYVCYSEKIGLNFMGTGREKLNVISNVKSNECFDINKETYEEHVSKMILAYNKYFYNEQSYIFNRLNISSVTDIDELIRFMIVIHDYGKLSKKWQEYAHEWQLILGDECSNMLLAHTDMKEEKVINKRPPSHSGAGAIISCRLLEDIMPDSERSYQIIVAIMTSILRHHGVDIKESYNYEIEVSGKDEIIKLISKYCENLYMKINKREPLLEKGEYYNLSGEICDFSDDAIIILYFLLVRILRLCDQLSFKF